MYYHEKTERKTMKQILKIVAALLMLASVDFFCVKCEFERIL